MEYDFRNRQNTPYKYNNMYTQPPPHSSTSSPSMMMYRNRVDQAAQPARIGQPTFHQQHPSHPHGLGIRVGINPKCRITPPILYSLLLSNPNQPELSPITGDVPHSTFQFDFDFESKILAEAEKDNPNWSRLGLEGLPSRTSGPPLLGPSTDPLVNKYIALGLSREAVPFALANYGDNPTKVKEFVDGFTTLREMGFSSNNVAEALAMYDSDYQKALVYFLNNPS